MKMIDDGKSSCIVMPGVAVAVVWGGEALVVAGQGDVMLTVVWNHFFDYKYGVLVPD